MRFLRTAPTRNLLALIGAVVAIVVAGTAFAVAATSGGPVPKAQPLAKSLHQALRPHKIAGISADITFTNNLISSTDFAAGPRDPILQGASGRLWWSPGNGARLELQTNNGDTEIVVNKHSFWISDPASQTVYEGTMPADSTAGKPATKPAGDTGVPTVAKIQSELTHLLAHVTLSGMATSNPTDVGGQPAYSVRISPKHSAGLLGSAQLAWDAANGIPLDIAITARGSSTPVLELKASNISFGAVPASDVTLSPTAGYKVVRIATPSGAMHGGADHGKHDRHAHVDGVKAVARHVPFTLRAPATLVGLPRHTATLLDWGGSPAALITYGENLGGLAVIEQKADKSAPTGSSSAPGSSASKLALPTVSINGATGTELGTALGTVLRYTKGGVSYTLIGSVLPSAAEQAARALTP